MLAHAIAYAFESHAGGRKVAERETAVVHLVLGTQNIAITQLVWWDIITDCEGG